MALAIENDSLVEISYTLRDEYGTVLDSTEEGRSFTYVHGRQRLLPALEEALIGMCPGEEKQLTVRPEDAYGLPDPTARAEVPRRALPPEALAPGTEVTAKRRNGETMFVTVEEVRDETVVLNLNHPFAGKTLHFHLRVVHVVSDPK
ncbi:MAG: peptidylprolyl isomerase [Candidatus Rokubacteria bacterium]|nr:peptidylprolyl isomerase [Candidatus Rokubacteria bacterium]